MRKLLKILLFFLTLYVNSVHAQVEKALPADNISHLTTTPFGYVIGQTDYRYWLNPYNGIYISKDNGSNFYESGLRGRVIQDISYNNETQTLYASTRDAIDGTTGIFYSKNNGNEWNHITQLNFSTWSVSSKENITLVGGASRGIWISTDYDQTWTQKLNTDAYGPDVYETYIFDQVLMAQTRNKVFYSTDAGQTWIEINEFENLTVNKLTSVNNIIFASTSNGIYKYQPNNNTFTKLNAFSQQQTKEIYSVGSILFVNANDSIYSSHDFGETWNRFIDSAATVKDVDWILNETLNIVFVNDLNQLVEASVEEKSPNIQPFLAIPWEYQTSTELIDKITAYFDHEYPLLGYSNHTEPENVRNTTTNFLGQTETPPTLYYSSHNGTDFAIPYGEDVLAPADGLATYSFCTACGNSINIDFLNGYKATFMHLRAQGLITTSSNPIWVNQGEKIGEVGTTGNSTGPHIHLEIFKKQPPEGWVDPFGWEDTFNPDPWQIYSWEDVLGTHKGSKSDYLWIEKSATLKNTWEPNTQIEHQNLVLKTGNNSPMNKITLKVQKYIQPWLSNEQQDLTYVNETSFLLEAYDQKANEMTFFDSAVYLTLKISEEILENLIKDSVKIYYLNTMNSTWYPLPNQTIDYENSTISATTNHFSHFAVFGKEKNSTSKLKVKDSKFTFE